MLSCFFTAHLVTPMTFFFFFEYRKMEIFSVAIDLLSWLVSTQPWPHLANVFPPSAPVPRSLALFQPESKPCYYVTEASHPCDDKVCACKRAAEDLIHYLHFSWDESLLCSYSGETWSDNKVKAWTSADRESMAVCGLVTLLAGGKAFIWFVALCVVFLVLSAGCYKCWWLQSLGFLFLLLNPLATGCVSKTQESSLFLKKQCSILGCDDFKFLSIRVTSD